MSWTVSDDFPKMPGLLKTIKCLKGPHKSMDYNYPDEIPFKNQVGRVCISFENFILNSLSLICIIDQMFMVHISQGRYLSGFADNMHMYLLCHLILWNLKTMSSRTV